jgi:hypothetical protein
MFPKAHLQPSDRLDRLSRRSHSHSLHVLRPRKSRCLHVVSNAHCYGTAVAQCNLAAFWPIVAQEFQGMDLTLLHVHSKPAGVKLSTLCVEAATTVRTYKM